MVRTCNDTIISTLSDYWYTSVYSLLAVQQSNDNLILSEALGTFQLHIYYGLCVWFSDHLSIQQHCLLTECIMWWAHIYITISQIFCHSHLQPNQSSCVNWVYASCYDHRLPCTRWLIRTWTHYILLYMTWHYTCHVPLPPLLMTPLRVYKHQ